MEKKAMEAWLSCDLPKAERLLLKAASIGSGLAAHNLGTLYATGGPGIDIDKAKSLKYFEISLASGFEETVSNDPTWFRRT